MSVLYGFSLAVGIMTGLSQLNSVFGLDVGKLGMTKLNSISILKRHLLNVQA